MHRAGGKGLRQATRAIGSLQPTEARITPGFDLPASYVIHTCAPVAQPRQVTASEAQLTQCDRNCLAGTAANQLHSIAFPCVGTRLRGFKHDRAACVALKAIIPHFEAATAPRLIRLVCRSDFDYRAYQAQISHPAIAPHLQLA